MDETRPAILNIAVIGAGSRYLRREPESTVLYQIVQQHLATFLARIDTDPERLVGTTITVTYRSRTVFRALVEACLLYAARNLWAATFISR